MSLSSRPEIYLGLAAFLFATGIFGQNSCCESGRAIAFYGRVCSINTVPILMRCDYWLLSGRR